MIKRFINWINAIIKKSEAPLVWLAFFLLLGGVIGLNVPFLLLLAAIALHLLV
jgi:hypothetical protein